MRGQKRLVNQAATPKYIESANSLQPTEIVKAQASPQVKSTHRRLSVPNSYVKPLRSLSKAPKLLEMDLGEAGDSPWDGKLSFMSRLSLIPRTPCTKAPQMFLRHPPSPPSNRMVGFANYTPRSPLLTWTCQTRFSSRKTPSLHSNRSPQSSLPPHAGRESRCAVSKPSLPPSKPTTLSDH